MIYKAYTGSKPLPPWLFYVMFWTIIPPAILALIVWETGKALAHPLQDRGTP